MATQTKKDNKKAVAIVLLLIGGGIAGFFVWKKYFKKSDTNIEENVEEVVAETVENLEFQSGKAVIKNSSFSSLQNLADLLNNNPNWKLGLVGHTDSDGNRQANLVLSKSRFYSRQQSKKQTGRV